MRDLDAIRGYTDDDPDPGPGGWFIPLARGTHQRHGSMGHLPEDRARKIADTLQQMFAFG